MTLQATLENPSVATREAIERFAESLRGALVTPDDPDYDQIRALYNGMIDKRPALIARARDVADVIATVNFARENQSAAGDPRRWPPWRRSAVGRRWPRCLTCRS